MTPYRERLLAIEREQGNGDQPVEELADRVAEQQEEPAAEPEPDEDETDDPEAGYVCAECGRGFETQHGLAVHEGKAHGDDG